jgi:hypothetical protein
MTRTATSLTFTACERDPSWTPEWVPRDAHYDPTEVEKLGQAAFIWNNFKVDATLTVGGADFSGATRYVCVLDLVLMLEAARTALRTDELVVQELSDRQDEWHFTRHDEHIAVRTRYATRDGWCFRPAEGNCTVTELDTLVEQALTDALGLIFSTQPATRRNPYLQGLASQGFDAA